MKREGRGRERRERRERREEGEEREAGEEREEREVVGGGWGVENTAGRAGQPQDAWYINEESDATHVCMPSFSSLITHPFFQPPAKVRCVLCLLSTMMRGVWVRKKGLHGSRTRRGKEERLQ